MKSLRLAGILAIFLLVMAWSACGDYYRPVANPQVPIQPNPEAAHLVLVITGNGTNNPGASTTIDVSGDTAISQATVGLVPVSAALVESATRVFVANSLDDTVSTFAPGIPTPVTTISLAPLCSAPPCSMPVFAASTELTTAYVASVGNGTENAQTYVAAGGNGVVSAVSITGNVVTGTVGVGINPVTMVEIPNGQTLYVANQGNGGANGSVTSINTIDLSPNPPISNVTWNSPVWVVSRSDGQRVYALDKGAGTVSAINTFSNAVVGSVSVGTGADYMAYDPTLNRVYVTNPVTGQLFSLDASTDALTLMTASVPNAVSAAATPDGTRVYVSSANVSGTTVSAQVTVFYTAALRLKTTISLGSVKASCTTRTWSELDMAASADSTRVYVGNCDAGNTAIIQTSNDTLVLNLAAPQSALPASMPGGTPPPQNPVFVLAGP
jgi:YVTN family beta-propeller protein